MTFRSYTLKPKGMLQTKNQVTYRAIKSNNLTLLILLLLALVTSCQEKDPLEGYVDFEESSGVGVLETTGEVQLYPKLLSDEITFKPETLIADSLKLNPLATYLDRKFLEDDVASKYFIDQVPGHIYKKTDQDKFRRVSIKRFIVKNAAPKVKIVNKEFFNNRIVDQSSLSIAAKIINVAVSKKDIMEMIIKDESTVILPDSLINFNLLAALIKKMDDSELEDYYFVYGTTLGSVTHKVFSEQKFNAKIDYAWLTASRETYGSASTMKSTMDVSLEASNLKDMKPIIDLNTTSEN